ncbi:hypothetical protein OFY01_18860 [Streptomyces sp. GXMU-J5]|uniref:Putative T7SS secretion signal domain-containing protein n=1 Tax=Streptomyces beihaiensis TaxID=2984495 RepID=A0ABT3TXN8_9ACTN|nr:hypothetical protein [Streptomyces beihaiensis]
MASELGSTNDPKELIPGDAGKLGQLETELTKWAKTFDGVGNGLRDLRINGWHGKAHDAFWPTLGKEKKNWYFASDAMTDAAKAVKSYVGTLTWAQGQAGTAIDKWNSGDHAAAEHLLKTARSQLKTEAGTLAKKLADLSGSASDSPDWLVAVRSGVNAQKWASDHNVAKSAISPEAWKKEEKKWVTDENSHWRRREKEFGKDDEGNWYYRNKAAADDGDDSTTPTPGRKADVSVKIAEWSGSASVWTGGVSGETNLGGVDLKGQAGVSVLGVDGSVGASIANGKAQVGASGTAYLAQATASGSANYGIVGVNAEGKAFAGADGSVKASVGKDGVHAGAEAFAGAKATGSASADVGGVGAGVNGEAWAGVGAEANVDLGMKDGKFTIGGDVGLGLGLGAKVGVDITIDPGKVVHSVGDAADAVGDAWDDTVGSWF